MIFTRYLASNIYRGAALVLLILVCLSLFFILIRQLDDLGKGQFGLLQLTQYMLLRTPAKIVDFMPLAALLGTLLSLGNLASNSELIAFQSSGLSIRKFIIALLQASFVLALFSFIIADFIVPYSETQAKDLKTSSIASRISMHSRRGVWVKDENNIIFIEHLFPDGNARNIEIYHQNENGELMATTFAQQAIANEQGWLLQKVRKSFISVEEITVSIKEQEIYTGKLSDQLLESLVVDPRLMSTSSLTAYISFLHQNKLNHEAASLFLWQKIYSPLTIIVMCMLAIPFVLGSQRQSNTGHRIVTGILLGLSFVVINRVLIQLGEQFSLLPSVNALIPTLIFVFITIFLIRNRLINT